MNLERGITRKPSNIFAQRLKSRNDENYRHRRRWFHRLRTLSTLISERGHEVHVFDDFSTGQKSESQRQGDAFIRSISPTPKVAGVDRQS